MPTQSEFLHYLLERIPGVEDSLNVKYSINTARILRQWVARNTNGFPNAHKYFNPYKIPLSKELELIDKSELGYSCGGFASFLQEIYVLFGFSAVRVGFGIPETSAMHAITLVVIENNGKPILSAQDAYLNGEYCIQSDRDVSDINDIILSLINRSAKITMRDYYPEETRTFIDHRKVPVEIYTTKMFDAVTWYNIKKRDHHDRFQPLYSLLHSDPDESESYDLLTSPRRIFLIENSGCVHDEFLLSSLDKMLKNTSEIVMAIDKEFGVKVQSFPFIV